VIHTNAILILTIVVACIAPIALIAYGLNLQQDSKREKNSSTPSDTGNHGHAFYSAGFAGDGGASCGDGGGGGACS
jgi:uncharacterized membrane protein YgcG